MRIVVIEHAKYEGPGTLAEFLVAEQVELRIVRMYEGDQLRDEFLDDDAIVSMGGPMNVYDEQEYPFLADETVFLRRAIASGKSVLGICLGAQMIAKALGATVSKAQQKEVGYALVTLTNAGGNDPLFQGAPRTLPVLQWHGDVFEVPAGAELLATGDLWPNQAFRYRNAYALQFHLEVDRAILTDWIDGDKGLLHVERDFEKWDPEVQSIAQKTFGNFMSLVRKNRVQS